MAAAQVSYGRYFHPGDHLCICHPAASIILLVVHCAKKALAEIILPTVRKRHFGVFFFLGSLVRSGSGVHEKKCQPNGLTRICLAVLYLRSNVLILLRISARNAAAAAIAMPANSVPCCAGTPVLP